MPSPIEDLLSRLPSAKPRPSGGWSAKCPAHNGQGETSLSIHEGDDGRALVKCWAGCPPDAIVSALGLRVADLFPEPQGNGHKPSHRLITLKELATAKGLPLEFLVKTLGWHDLPGGGVGLPYRDETGNTIYIKRRTALKASQGSYWPKGVNLMAYGLESLHVAQDAGYLIAVEGETDVATLRYHGFHAVRVPGADSTKVLMREHLDGIQTVCAWQEPDKGGTTFVRGLAARLQEIGFQGVYKVIRVPGVKDPAAWYQAEPQGFREAFRHAMDEAEPYRDDGINPLKAGLHCGLALTSLADLLAEPDDVIEWLADGLLPHGGFSLLAGKPKAGKSTLARCLALSVARGEPFLDRDTSKGPVIYLALEEKRSEVRKHFRAMGAIGEEAIYIFAATAPADAMEQIRQVVDAKKPALIIIDPLFRLTRVKDGNDYAQVTQALEPLLALARETGAHVLCVHHLGKGERAGGDAILGSTAIYAAVDTALIIRRTDRYRLISSSQRYGEDLPDTVLAFEPQTRTIRLGKSIGEEEGDRMAESILAILQSKPDGLIEAEINAEVEGRIVYQRQALRDLVKAGKVARHGRGGKGDPFRYVIALIPDNPSGNNNPPDESTDNSREMTPQDAQKDSCSLVPTIYREQGNKNPKYGVTTGNHSEYSCSQDLAESGNIGNKHFDAGNKQLCHVCGEDNWLDLPRGDSVCLTCSRHW
jgi:hypothetical protein